MRQITGTVMALLFFGVPIGVMFAMEGFWLGLAVLATVVGIGLWFGAAMWLIWGD